MRTARVVGTTLLLVLACSVGTAQAASSTPLGLGGQRPVIAVDAAGRAHIAWEVQADGSVQYCRVPAGGTTCEISVNLGRLGSSNLGALNIFAPSPSALRVFATGTCNGTQLSIVRWESGDGGASWGAPACMQTGTGRANTTRQANVLDAQDRLMAAGGSEAGKYFNAQAPGATATTQPEITVFSTGNFYDVATAITGSGASSRLVAAAYSLDSANPGIRYSVFNGAPDTSDLATLNTPANWTSDLAAPNGGPSIDVPRLISGPSGLFLVFNDRNEVTNDRIAVERFDPATARFGAPVIIDGSGNDDFQSLPDATQDAGGRLHLLWNGRNGMRYTVSADGGATFQTLGALAPGEIGPVDRKLAAGPDGRGWVVFQDPNDRSTIRLVPLEPTSDALPVAGGTGTPPPVTPPTAAPPRTLLPGAPGTPIRRVTSSANGGAITFGTPRGCVNPGQQFVVTMTWRKQKRKGNVFVKVTRADFYIGEKVVKTDRKVPYTQTLRVTASAKRGSTVRLRARAFIKVKRGKQPKKSIFSTVKVCA